MMVSDGGLEREKNGGSVAIDGNRKASAKLDYLLKVMSVFFLILAHINISNNSDDPRDEKKYRRGGARWRPNHRRKKIVIHAHKYQLLRISTLCLTQ